MPRPRLRSPLGSATVGGLGDVLGVPACLLLLAALAVAGGGGALWLARRPPTPPTAPPAVDPRQDPAAVV